MGSGRDSVGRGQHSSNQVSGNAEQCTSLQLHSCHRLFDKDRHQGQFLTLPIVQTLLPVTFGYSLSSEALVMRQLTR